MKSGRVAVLFTLILTWSGSAWTQAFPIHSDVALQPAEDQWIYRTQLRLRDFEIDGTTPHTEGHALINSQVLVYGYTSRLSMILAAPGVYRDLDTPTGGRDDFGVGDFRFIVRHQPWKKLGKMTSESFTVLAGLEIPSYDTPFSSRSWDPLLGATYSWRKDRRGFDADLVYQFNTENDRDFESGDLLRIDTALQYRLHPIQYRSDTRWSLSAILEINGEFRGKAKQNSRRLPQTESQQIFISPGLVWAGKESRFELGLQIPVYQEVGNLAPEDTIRWVVGYTRTF